MLLAAILHDVTAALQVAASDLASAHKDCSGNLLLCLMHMPVALCSGFYAASAAFVTQFYTMIRNVAQCDAVQAPVECPPLPLFLLVFPLFLIKGFQQVNILSAAWHMRIPAMINRLL